MQAAGAAASKLLALRANNTRAPPSGSVIPGNSNHGKEFVVAVRGAGEFVGEMALLGGSSKRCATIRTKSPEVKVAIIPYGVAKEFLANKPVVCACMFFK